MRFTLTLSSHDRYIQLPIHYNLLIQSAIYHNLQPEFANFLHDKGFIIDNRRFALFTFSRIIGRFQLLPKEKKVRFESPIQIIISSPVDEFIHNMAQLLLKDGFRLGSQQLRVTSLKMEETEVDKHRILVQTLSPVVAYSTLLRSDGRKYTLYFEPHEKEFRQIVANNLLRKARLIYGEEINFAPIEITPIGRHKKNLITYKNIIIKGHSGRFLLSGDPLLLRTALEAGIGSKNSMGFGLIEIKNNETRYKQEVNERACT